jgi:hypothetical protein
MESHVRRGVKYNRNDIRKLEYKAVLLERGTTLLLAYLIPPTALAMTSFPHSFRTPACKQAARSHRCLKIAIGLSQTAQIRHA